MTFTREINGSPVTFELSSAELEAAYREQQAQFDREDVSLILDEYADDGESGEQDFIDYYGAPIAKARELLPQIVGKYRDIRDDGECALSWRGAVDMALEYWLKGA